MRKNLKLTAFRLADETIKALNAKGGNRSDHLRRAIKRYLVYLDGHKDVSEDLLNEFQEFKVQLRGIGTNLNQLARFWNQERDLDRDALQESHEELRKTFNSLTRFFERLDQELRDRV